MPLGPTTSRLLAGLCAILLTAPATDAALVGYWNFNEGSGTTANDSTANHNNGTLESIGGGVPAWVAGHTGVGTDKALTFNQGVVRVPDAASLHLTTTFTLAAWTIESNSNYGHLFVAGETSTTRNWLWQTANNHTDSSWFYSDGNSGLRKKLNYLPTQGPAWHHLALTYDGANLRIYQDAVLKTTTAMTSAMAAWGTLRLGGSTVSGSGYVGTLDDMVIFNTVENVTAIMSGTHPEMLSWNGGGTPNGSAQLVWSDAANWGGVTMSAGLTLTFAASGASGAATNYNDFANSTQFGRITFNAGSAAFTLNGNTVNLTGDVINNSASTQTIGNPLTLDGGTRTFNAAAGDLVLGSGIAQAAAQTNGVVKSGSFALKLNGTSSYGGATTVTAGTLLLNTATLGNTATTVAGASSALAGSGSVGGAVAVSASGHLAPGVNTTITGTLACNNGLTLNTANLDIKAAAPGTNDSISVTGNLVLTGNTQINLTQQLAGFGLGDYVILTYSGTLTGSVSQILPPPQDASYSYSIQAAGNQIKLHVAPSSALTYYVSQSAGNDANTGLTSAAPWQTLARASTVTLNAGDSILLKSGDTWNEELQPKGSGTAGSPIYIGSYGAGNKPLIDRLDYTQDRNGIHLINQAGYKIVGLEFTRCMSGIYAEYAVGSPNRNYLWIEDCYFHDSLKYQHYENYPTSKIGLGISLFSHETANNIVLSDITVKNCTFRRLASGIWTNSPDNFNYYTDNIWNFGNLNVLGCLFEEGYQWQLGLRGISGGQIANCVTHDIGRGFAAFNGVAGAMMYRLKNFTFTDSEWGFVSRNGGASGDGEAFDLEGNNANMTFTRCLFHDTDGPCFMLFKGSNASPSNTDILFTDCVWNGKAALSNLGREEIFNASPGTATATFASSIFYLSSGVVRCNNNTGMTFTNCLSRNLSDAGTGTNVALATTSSASSQQVGFEAAKGNDGNVSSIWRPASAANEWLELDFAGPTLVNEFRLREEAGSSISRYTVQYWDSATSSWVGCFNGRTMGSNFIAPIVSRTTTKLRLLITATTAGTPGIAEFEAYYVALPPPPSTTYWRVGDGVWDINTTNNWKNTGGTPVNYVDGDSVILDDTASGGPTITITLNTNVSPTSVTVNATKDYVITGSGGIGGSGILTKTNSGTLTLSGTTTYSGGTLINGGILSFATAGSLPTGGVIFGGGTLEFTGSGAAGTYDLSASGGSSYLVNVINAAGSLTVTRANANYNGMIKGGAGTLILANNNQDSGGLQVDAGTVILSGTSSNPVNWSTTNTISDVKTGATLKLGNTQVGLIFYGGGTFRMSGGTFDLNGQNPTADLNHSAPVIDGSGTITSSAAGTTGTALFNLGTNSKTFSGNIVDGASAGKVAITLTSGTGTWTVSGNNTYSGATKVSSGILQAGSTSAFSANSAYTVASGKTLALNDYNNAIGSLTGAGNVTFGAATLLTIGNDNTSPAAFTGTLSGASGGLAKIGNGTLTLSGNNSYGGTTTVSGGQLLLTNTTGSATGTGPIGVSVGGTLGGTGSATGNVTVTGGTVNPGLALGTFGTLSLGGLTFNGGTLIADIANASTYDRLVVSNTVTLGASVAALSLSSGYTAALTDNFFLVKTTDDSTPVSGNFAGLAEGQTFGLNAQTYRITYKAEADTNAFTGGNDIAIKLAWTYAAYQAAYGVGAAAADDDRDGLSNFLEYALNTNPVVRTPSPFAYSVNGSNRNQLVYTRPAAGNLNQPSPTVTYKGEVCSALNTTWSTTGVTESVSNNGNGTETVTITDNAPNADTATAGKRFIHLKVTQ
ncbi:MAG: autotransporter-associated beta strand repeat-containing protein [Chthoniobacter sp.]|nr:autotransporter-associated beta strand repeat-containing protein [Chthoniobacter sp.]